MRSLELVLCLDSLAAQNKPPLLFINCDLYYLLQEDVFELPLVIPTDLSFTSYTLQILSQAETGKQIIHKLPLHSGGKSFQMP